jgi:DNA-binding PadR family transcriptional regulator
MSRGACNLQIFCRELHRLEYKGWIQAEWGASENNRKAKYYSLTRTGQKQLQAELEDWVGSQQQSP